MAFTRDLLERMVNTQDGVQRRRLRASCGRILSPRSTLTLTQAVQVIMDGVMHDLDYLDDVDLVMKSLGASHPSSIAEW
ncbi:hypothetical protein [Agromyces sp. NPDC049794]|uniref:hypothetical protein n=1 Tax=unclassified Agromyces TaxID=2639701 RepID=UPI0034074463